MAISSEWAGLPVSPTLPYLRVSKVCLMPSGNLQHARQPSCLCDHSGYAIYFVYQGHHHDPAKTVGHVALIPGSRVTIMHRVSKARRLIIFIKTSSTGPSWKNKVVYKLLSQHHKHMHRGKLKKT